MRPSVQLRLLHRLEPDPLTGCLLWAGARSGTHGEYGHMWADGRYRLTHRVAYELFVGPIPDGLVIDHLCRRPLCANPKHLEAVTQSVNTRRGDLPALVGGRERAKTHCPQGHEYNEANTYLRPNGAGRMCRACQRESYRRTRLARRGSLEGSAA